ncbi:MAG: hypothetical protein ABI831_16360 [Betaproteobacteria bacterium]
MALIFQSQRAEVLCSRSQVALRAFARARNAENSAHLTNRANHQGAARVRLRLWPPKQGV